MLYFSAILGGTNLCGQKQEQSVSVFPILVSTPARSSTRRNGYNSPPPYKMPPREMRDQRLRRRQTNQILRMKLCARSALRGPILDRPGGGRVNGGDGDGGLFEGGDDGGEGGAGFTGKGEAWLWNRRFALVGLWGEDFGKGSGEDLGEGGYRRSRQQRDLWF